MSKIVIRAENISKRYLIPDILSQEPRSLGQRLRHSTGAAWGRLRAVLRNQAADNATKEFWALRDISFEVAEGEVLGIIGMNGAGKSTLLKLISEITAPTTGSIDIYGRVGSLLEVGTGFHADLTGRENVFMNGVILGMSRAEIQRKFDDIVAFAGVEQFIDTPVKRYSSGMTVRLAFAVAAFIEPEILVVDEVLAVGDAAFQKKSLGKMENIAHSGRTILFVSHNMESIMGLCTRVMWLEGGRIRAVGAAQDIVRQYLQQTMGQAQAVPLADRTDRRGTGDIRLTQFSLRDGAGNPIHHAVAGDSVQFVWQYEVRRPIRVPVQIWFWINETQYNRGLLCLWSRLTGDTFGDLPERGELVCTVPRFPITPGRYALDVRLRSESDTLDDLDSAAFLEVQPGDFYGTGRPLEGLGHYLCDHGWQAQPLLAAPAAPIIPTTSS